MAEFIDVIKNARRICGAYKDQPCEHCALDTIGCLMTFDLLKDDLNGLKKFEEVTMKWAAEHPEPQYPTWEEWQNENFPDARVRIRPCEFMSEDKWLLNSGCDCVLCDDCYRRRIPAEIAEKLGIKPKEGES